MGALFWLGPQVLARVGDWSKEQMNKGEQSGEVPFHTWRCHHELPRVSRSPEQAVWSRVAIRSASQDHVLGALFLHYGQAKEGGAGVERVAQMFSDRVPQNRGEDRWWNQVVVRLHAPPDKWLPPLPSYDGSPVVGE